MSSQKPQAEERWQSISRRKKEEQYKRIPEEWKLNTLPGPDVTSYVDIPRRPDVLLPEELRITEQYDAVALAQAIRQKKFSCVDVARAFCKVSLERDGVDMPRLTCR
jgi:amidase